MGSQEEAEALPPVTFSSTGVAYALQKTLVSLLVGFVLIGVASWLGAHLFVLLLLLNLLVVVILVWGVSPLVSRQVLQSQELVLRHGWYVTVHVPLASVHRAVEAQPAAGVGANVLSGSPILALKSSTLGLVRLEIEPPLHVGPIPGRQVRTIVLSLDRPVEFLTQLRRYRAAAIGGIDAQGAAEEALTHCPTCARPLSGAVAPAPTWRRKEGSHIDAVFLIHADGRVVTSYQADLALPGAHSLSGMLTAVQDFVSETLKGRSGDLAVLAHGDSSIVMERSALLTLAVVVSGSIGAGLRPAMRACLAEVTERYGDSLAEWDGDLSAFPGVNKVVSQVLWS